MTNIRLIAAVLSVFVVACCGTTNQVAGSAPSDTQEEETSTTENTEEQVQEETPPAEPPSAEQGSGDFEFDLYRRLIGKGENLFISPFSLKTALAMVYAGARGETEKQMAATIGFPLPQNVLHDEMKTMLGEMVGEKGLVLDTANAIWPSKSLPLGPDYVELLKNSYLAGVTPLDYTAVDKSISAINSWTNENTKGKIEEIVGRSHISASTLMVLTNAIYFFGPWEEEFDSERTHNHPFKISKDKTVEVPMMSRTKEQAFYMDEEVAVVELPYRDDRYSMIVVVPAEMEGLYALEQKLSKELFDSWVQGLKTHRVSVNLPKFEIESEFELAKHLVALGMADAFSSSADFSGMVPAGSLGEGNLHLSEVVQKAVVTVGEEGTEAAAATAAMMKISMPPRLLADHPFMFVIRDKKTNKNLFLGRVIDPS